jgi:uncharacterized membrane protein YtjA (UPF0391 family)
MACVGACSSFSTAVRKASFARLASSTARRRRRSRSSERASEVALHALAFVDLDANAGEADERAVAQPRRAPVEDPAVLAIAPAQPVFDGERLSRVERAHGGIQPARQVFRMQRAGPAVPERRILGKPGELEPGGAHRLARQVGARGPEHERQGGGDFHGAAERRAGDMPGTACSGTATACERSSYLRPRKITRAPVGVSARHRHALCSSLCSFTHHLRRSVVMLSWALAFFIIAIIAAVFGFTGIAAGAAEIAKILFVVFVVLFLVSLVAGLLRRP